MSSTHHPIDVPQTGHSSVSLRYLDFEGTRSVIREHLCGESAMPIAKSASVTPYQLKVSDKLYCAEDTTFTPESNERELGIISMAGYYGLVPLDSCGSYFSLNEPLNPVLPPIFELLDGIMVLTAGHAAFFQMMCRSEGKPAGNKVIFIRHILFRHVVEATVPQLCPVTAHEFREMSWVRSPRGEKRRIIFA